MFQPWLSLLPLHHAEMGCGTREHWDLMGASPGGWLDSYSHQKFSFELFSHSPFLESFEESGLRFAAQQFLGAVCLPWMWVKDGSAWDKKLQIPLSGLWGFHFL